MRSRSTSASALTVLAAMATTVAAGCAGAPSDLAEGQRCVRTTQCLDGLVCGPMGMCTSDLEGMGVVPPPPPSDAQIDAEIDAGSDGGPIPDFDAGPEMDSGPAPEIDAFVEPEIDAFVAPEIDAFVAPEIDAYVEVDAFVEVDAL